MEHRNRNSDTVSGRHDRRRVHYISLILVVPLVLIISSVAVAATFNATRIFGTYVVPTGATALLLRGAQGFSQLVPWVGALSIGVQLYKAFMVDDSSPTPGQVNIRPGNAAPYPDVPGWSSPTAPPSSKAGFWRWNDPNVYYSSKAAAGQAACDALATSPNATNHVLTWEPGTVNPPLCDGVWVGTWTNGLSAGGQVVQVCGNGWTANGSNCVLSNSSTAQWDPDGVPTMEPNSNGTAWQSVPRDPDPAVLTCSGTTCTWNGSDKYGNPSRYTWTANPDGGVTHKQQTQGTDTSGQTYVRDQSFTTDNTGKVTNVTNNTTSNTTINNYTNPVPAAGGGAPVNIQLPTDYAREPTLQESKGLLQQILDWLKKEPEAPNITDNPDGIPEHNEGLPAINGSGPRVGGGCPAPLTAVVLGHTYSFDLVPMCNLAMKIAPLVIGFTWLLCARIAFGGSTS